MWKFAGISQLTTLNDLLGISKNHSCFQMKNKLKQSLSVQLWWAGSFLLNTGKQMILARKQKNQQSDTLICWHERGVYSARPPQPEPSVCNHPDVPTTQKLCKAGRLDWNSGSIWEHSEEDSKQEDRRTDGRSCHSQSLMFGFTMEGAPWKRSIWLEIFTLTKTLKLRRNMGEFDCSSVDFTRWNDTEETSLSFRGDKSNFDTISQPPLWAFNNDGEQHVWLWWHHRLLLLSSFSSSCFFFVFLHISLVSFSDQYTLNRA